MVATGRWMKGVEKFMDEDFRSASGGGEGSPGSADAGRVLRRLMREGPGGTQAGF